MRDYEQKQPLDDEHSHSKPLLIASLSALDRDSLALVGGKAANLGEMIQAGFNVPEGFCLTTAIYRDLSTHTRLDPLLKELAETHANELERLASLARQIHALLLHAPLSTDVIEAVSAEYYALGNGEAVPVAVRSSATAEDLPDASFAGQLETILNVKGIEAVLAAIGQCFASLWTDRVVIYRARQGIDHRTVQLAVIVQRLIDAEVAGVLFTANPLTGKRRQVVINANPGLGEAVVSGATNPDQFVVNTTSGEIVERHLGDKQVMVQAVAEGGTQQSTIASSPSLACLTDDQIQALTALGVRVEAHYAAPQDIEWALAASGQIYLLQSRSITTLFPPPADAPDTDKEIRAYMAFGVQQGTHQPFTPMGISVLRLLASVVVTLMGQAPTDPLKGPRFVKEAAARPYFDVTTALRSSLGRSLLARGMRQAEVHAYLVFQQLADDTRFSLLPTRRLPLVRAVALFIARTRVPLYLLSALLWPERAISRVYRFVQSLKEGPDDPPVGAEAILEAVERYCFATLPRLFRSATPTMVAGMISIELAQKLLGESVSESELQVILGGTASNPTTEMTRVLWNLAQELSSDSNSVQLLQQRSMEQLAIDYHNGQLPPRLQRGLARFLANYGERCVNELDVGVARWSEDPTYMLGMLASYQRIEGNKHPPDQHLQQAAKSMIATLSRRASSKNWIRGKLVNFFLKRAQTLAGMREMSRFCGNLLLVQVRSLLSKVGEELARTGQLRSDDDIFFLTLSEAREALAGSNVQALVEERRSIYTQEQRRRHVPLILLSDGTEPIPLALTDETADRLQGTPASPGKVSAIARVLFNPQEELLPGEILVAPSTDPGWTPLFLKAAGLVMETGGAMAHGAIVAREYSIPAVVGVQGATSRITTGSRITVNGTDGTIMSEED